VQYVAGGATQNSIRVFAALAGESGVASYSGCVGIDHFATQMRELCESAGIVVDYCVDSEQPTGVCGVGIVGMDRSLCPRLGAADKYRLAHLKESVWKHVEKADMVYSAGFFLTPCTEGMVMVGKHCTETNKMFLTNLSASFLVETFTKPMMKVFYHADVVFGNEHEWASFGKIHKIDSTDLTDIAKHAVALPKANEKLPRLIVVTRGDLETIVVTKSFSTGKMEIFKYEVDHLDKSEIVDTNAAGDAFVGGFLYGMSHWGGGNLDSAVKYAHYAAGHVIKRSGCTFDFTDKPAPNVS